MTATTSIYREKGTDSPYYYGSENRMWDNYHTLFLESGNSEETIAFLLDINPRLNILERPENNKPKSIFKSSPHVLIVDSSESHLREFYIEDWLESHLGWKDKKNPTLYSPFGYDVFLIRDRKHYSDEWVNKPAVLGLEFFDLIDYQNWLEKFPGNG
jgi:hypothetical protein